MKARRNGAFAGCGHGLVLALSLAGPHVFGADAAPKQTAAARSLFNGTNLTGFTTWMVDTKRADPRRVFTVTNGMIRISGEGLGYLATEEECNDYELSLEFRWGARNWAWGGREGKARDSGLFLHSVGPDGNSHDGGGAFRAAIECQIMQGATGDFLLIRGTNFDGSLIAPRLTVLASGELDADGWPFWDHRGPPRTLERWGRVNWSGKSRAWRDTLEFRGDLDAEKPPGQWNQLVCACSGSAVEVRLNGRLVNAAFEVHPARGRILLQCEGSEIFFRNLRLRSLRRP